MPNKKMARMMISLLLQHNKILSKQLLCISSYILQDKIRFDDRVSTVRILGDYKQWVKAFLKGIIITAERTITIIDNLMQLKIRDEGKVIEVAKSVVDLQEMGILTQSNNLLRNRCFVYKEYLSIFQV
jgi:Fic family protein